MFKFEFVGPGDEWAPEELVGGDDDEDDDQDAGREGAHVSGVGGGLEVAAEAGELEAFVAHGEHFAGDEGEPAAGDGDDGVPDEADGGVGHFQLPETLPGGVAVDAGCLEHLFGDGFKGGVEAEGEVPDLAGEDEEDDAEFNAELVAGDKGDHGEDDWREEAEDRDGLEDVEGGDHPGLDAGVVGGDVSVGDGEGKREDVGDADADDGVEGVDGQGADGVGDGDDGDGGAHPIGAEVDDGEEEGEAAGGDADVDDEGPTAGHDEGFGEGVLEGAG